MPSRPAAAVLVLAAAAGGIGRSSAFAPAAPSSTHSSTRRNADAAVFLHMSTTSASSRTIALAPPSGILPMALKKPSKTLTVCLEYDAAGDLPSSTSSSSSSSTSDLATLSMQLRKSQTAAIFTSDVAALSTFAEEQETARGDFPGPCPVIYSGNVEGISDAVKAGAAAVVLRPDSASIRDGVGDGDALQEEDVDVIWDVRSADDVAAALDLQEDADTFLIGCGGDVDVDDVEAIIAALPGKSCCAIGTAEAMQDVDGELSQGRALQSAGCASILLRHAAVGDDEDVPYAQYAIGGLTSKKSSEFNFSGLTGSANGHFGGVATSSSGRSGKGKGGNRWKRDVSLGMVANSVVENALEEIEDADNEEEEEGERQETGSSIQEIMAAVEMDDEDVKEEEPQILASAEEDIKEEEERSDGEEAMPEPELIEALTDVEPEVETEPEPEVEPEPEPEPELVSNLSDAAKYFLSSSGLRKSIPEAEAKSAASTAKEREDAARRELEPRIGRLGIGADEEEDV